MGRFSGDAVLAVAVDVPLLEMLGLDLFDGIFTAKKREKGRRRVWGKRGIRWVGVKAEVKAGGMSRTQLLFLYKNEIQNGIDDW